jgi:hypothetical protein
MKELRDMGRGEFFVLNLTVYQVVESPFLYLFAKKNQKAKRAENQVGVRMFGQKLVFGLPNTTWVLPLDICKLCQDVGKLQPCCLYQGGN